jgi:hypothetical protein
VLALQVQRDGVEPRLEALRGVEIETRAMQLQERLLHEVAGFLALGEIPQHDAFEAGRVALEQRAKCRRVTRDVRGHQLFVRLHGVPRRASVKVTTTSSGTERSGPR